MEQREKRLEEEHKQKMIRRQQHFQVRKLSGNEGSIQKYKIVGGNHPNGGPKMQSSEASYLESSQTESVEVN